MPLLSHPPIQHHNRRDSCYYNRRSGSHRAIRYLHVTDSRRQHHREDSQYQYPADVNEELHQRDKIRREQNVDTHCAHECAQQRKGRINYVARERHQRGRSHRQRGQRIEYYLCEHRFALPRVAGPRALCRLFSGGLLAARLRPLIEVGHAAIQDWRDSRIRLRPLLGLVRHHRILDEATNQALQRIVSALELRRMMYRSGWTHLAAQPTVHALGDVYIELRQQQLPRLLILLGHDDYAIDRAGALARQASRADFEIDIEDPAITERQRVLHAHRHPIRILHRVRLAHEVRRRYRHALEDRRDRVLYIMYVFRNRAHRQPLYSRIEVNFHPRTPEIVDNPLNEYCPEHPRPVEHDIADRHVAVGPYRCPHRGADHIHERYRHEVLPACCR